PPPSLFWVIICTFSTSVCYGVFLVPPLLFLTKFRFIMNLILTLRMFMIRSHSPIPLSISSLLLPLLLPSHCPSLYPPLLLNIGIHGSCCGSCRQNIFTKIMMIRREEGEWSTFSCIY